MSVLRRIPYWAAIALLIYMPFHVFLAQSLSLLTGGLEAWKVGKDIVLAVAVLFTICLVWQQKVGNRQFNLLVGFSVLYFGMHLLLWRLNPDIYQKSAVIGIIYNMRLPGFLLLGYGAALLDPSKFVFSSVSKMVLGVSTVVAALGVIQYFLPGDLLAHFGYSIARGARAAFYIDDNHNLPIRIMATLREPNALGAYLVLPATLLAALLLRTKDKNKRYVFIGALVIDLIAIVLTQSRSAMLGVILAFLLVVWWQYREWFVRKIKQYRVILAVLLALVGIGSFAMRNSAFFQDYVIHGNKGEKVADIDSNGYHELFIKRGLEGIKDKPLGHGPGTAGLASIQNPKGSFLTENYYIQIGYEIGVIGLALFVAFNLWTYLRIQQQKSEWSAVLMASFWAYVVTNMLLHTWSNEAVAAQWWILAGVACVEAAYRCPESLPNRE